MEGQIVTVICRFSASALFSIPAKSGLEITLPVHLLTTSDYIPTVGVSPNHSGVWPKVSSVFEDSKFNISEG